MRHGLSIRIVLIFLRGRGTLRAAAKPHAGPASVRANPAWTNADQNRLGTVPGLISFVGVPANQTSKAVAAPTPQSKTEDPAWYAERAAYLEARREAGQADLRVFTQALDDVRELKSTAGGVNSVNLAQDDIGITPHATIEILKTAFVKPKENSTRWKTLQDKTTFHLEFCAATGQALREAVPAAAGDFNAFSQAIHGGFND